jgi:hypothetical protein
MLTTAVSVAGVDGEDVAVCSECLRYLARAAMPPASLVRLDTGPWPVDADGPLPCPSFIEATILAPWRPLRSVITCRHGAHIPDGTVGAGDDDTLDGLARGSCDT